MRQKLDCCSGLQIRRRIRVSPQPRVGLRLLVLLASVLMAIGALPELRAQPGQTSAPVLVSSNRFLFVVDTSAAMKRHLPEVSKVVGEIITSGASGQLRRGDTLGLWTFDKDVYSDLPLQAWDMNERDKIAVRITDFLRSQTFSGASRFDNLLSLLMPLVRNSDVITIIIISDGKAKISGTPFDQEINDLYRQSLKEAKNHPEPIITVLQGRGGKVFKYTVNALPWPTIIPEVPATRPSSQPPAVTRQLPYTLPQPIVKPAQSAPPVIARTPPPTDIPKPPPQITEPIQPPPNPAAQPDSVPGKPAPPIASVPVAPPPVSPPSMIPPPPPFTPPTAARSEAPKAPAPVAPVEQSSPPLVITLKPGASQPPAPAAEAAAATPPAPARNPPAAAPANTPPPDRSLALAAPEISSRPKALLIAGLVLAVVGFFLIILTVARGRDTGPSLITRSMSDKRK